MKEKNQRNYQKMTAELAAIIDWFEGDKVNLDEAVTKYKQALKLITEIETYLKTAENEVKKISIKFE